MGALLDLTTVCSTTKLVISAGIDQWAPNQWVLRRLSLASCLLWAVIGKACLHKKSRLAAVIVVVKLVMSDRSVGLPLTGQDRCYRLLVDQPIDWLLVLVKIVLGSFPVKSSH